MSQKIWKDYSSTNTNHQESEKTIWGGGHSKKNLSNSLKSSLKLSPNKHLQLEYNTSHKGWEFFLKDLTAKGSWLFKVESIVSNVLELKAAGKVLLAIAPKTWGLRVLL